jgi:hypothetical protein
MSMFTPHNLQHVQISRQTVPALSTGSRNAYLDSQASPSPAAERYLVPVPQTPLDSLPTAQPAFHHSALAAKPSLGQKEETQSSSSGKASSPLLLR